MHWPMLYDRNLQLKRRNLIFIQSNTDANPILEYIQKSRRRTIARTRTTLGRYNHFGHQEVWGEIRLIFQLFVFFNTFIAKN